MTVATGSRYERKVVVVTGGGCGIGAAMCRAFAAEGATVAVLDRDADAARAIAAECGGASRGVACDVADAASVRTAFDEVRARLERVDVLVNNAGVSLLGSPNGQAVLARLREQLALAPGARRDSLRATSTTPDEEWDLVVRVHLHGTFHCSREALRDMEERRAGAILNLGSVAGLQGMSVHPAYAAAKGAIHALTKSMAREVAGAGIRVNAIAPGWIETNMPQAIPADLLAGFVGQVPLARSGRPEEIAALALHLCSDEAGYTTGQVISPNGGSHC